MAIVVIQYVKIPTSHKQNEAYFNGENFLKRMEKNDSLSMY